jgi:hypothetical protein
MILELSRICGILAPFMILELFHRYGVVAFSMILELSHKCDIVVSERNHNITLAEQF